MRRPLKIITVMLKLGIWNVVRVVRYRLALRYGTLSFQPRTVMGRADLFFSQPNGSAEPRSVDQRVYGWKDVRFDAAPDWHASVFEGNRRINSELPWMEALAAVAANVDVKEFWELSRFYWVPHLAQQAVDGDASAIATLNHWLKDWEQQNPPYLGVNWSCGQEAALRILHCAKAAMILGDIDSAQPALVRFLSNSAARIAPTLHYALGQANNHGSAEAAGLFIAGAWLERLGADPRAKGWKELGRRWLENRARTLILDDGSSNQYSTNYHRVVLDTYSFVELWRRKLDLSTFTDGLMDRLKLATGWLYAMTDATTGRAPFFGANDGSLLLTSALQDHRDFRPSVQLAAALFSKAAAYRTGVDDAVLGQYGIEASHDHLPDVRSRSFEHGGYHLLRRKSLKAVMRFPSFAFRPGHADALHVEVHRNGMPVFFDAGTFSYVPYPKTEFGKTGAHNTVEFDGRNQMPSLSRFLYSDWLRVQDLQLVSHGEAKEHCAAGYTDANGATHSRSLTLEDDALHVTDYISGFEKMAIIRWRLASCDYLINGNTVTTNTFTLSVSQEGSPVIVKVVDSHFAPFYNKLERCKIIEVHTSQPGKIATKIKFHQCLLRVNKPVIHDFIETSGNH